MAPHRVASALSWLYHGTEWPPEAPQPMDSSQPSISICLQVKPATITILVLKRAMAHARNTLHLIQETDQSPALLNSFNRNP